MAFCMGSRLREAHGSAKPAVLQARSDPMEANCELQAAAAALGVAFEAYSTLGGQYWNLDRNPVLTSDAVTRLAAEKRVGAGSVVLRWALQRQQVVIPRSSNPERMRANLREPFTFALSDAEMASIDALDARCSRRRPRAAAPSP